MAEKEFEIVKRKLITAINEAKSPQEKLKAYIYTRMKCLQELANIYSALKDEYLKHYQFVQKLREDYDREEINIVKSILQEGIKKKTFKINDMDLTSSTIVIALKGLEYEWVAKNEEITNEKNIDKLLDILFYGITKR